MSKYVNYVIDCLKRASYILGLLAVFYIVGFLIICDYPELHRMTYISMVIVALIGGILHFIAFSDNVIKRCHYAIRIIIFSAPFFIIFVFSAYHYKWIWATLTFAGIRWLLMLFVIIMAIILIIIELYHKHTSNKYAGLLGEYKKKQEQTRTN